MDAVTLISRESGERTRKKIHLAVVHEYPIIALCIFTMAAWRAVHAGAAEARPQLPMRAMMSKWSGGWGVRQHRGWRALKTSGIATTARLHVTRRLLYSRTNVHTELTARLHRPLCA